ncbi:sigma-54 interaction domain-containing protein [Marinospirillum alkaliphilum]|uniref:Sigma54 specific transcriptional regulator, Fis family n=1 Tax=Marinospirillum alkaliphilum DSM 21637 TaxID=1122209 RepID=A0A1K1YV58_9GAMM|nr:sigma-54-dependent Fis family transcriptional regulator [Marinospirillum alkaliphilum]SFX65711.1 sigma54 specific transcriptional regulator, Fis family [Marinospirillum alkaliphilum DSM 21637]
MISDRLSELQALLDAIPEPATLISLDYRILATNRAYRSIYVSEDCSPQQLLQKTCYAVSHGYDRPCDLAGEACPLRRCQETGQRQRVLHLHQTPRGEEHVDVELTPVCSASGETQAYLEILHRVREAAASAGADEGLVGRSPAFQQMLALMRRAAPSDISVLLLGETGTGKELVARALHDASARGRKPFVTVECSGLPETLFESELFGHEKGAFTGAVGRKKGLVEAAHGGTLFLDEIGEIPLPQQVKLLRLIETGTYRSVGGTEPQHASFRLICATHRDLPDLVKEGYFRADLYYRISAFPIHLPSLAERREDLPLLAETLLRRLPGGETVRLGSTALACLQAYAFPGNIRELRNLLERGILLADEGVIEVEHLPQHCQIHETTPDAGQLLNQVVKQVLPLDQLEQHYLTRLLHAFDGDRRALAARLGISERTLYRKLARLS